jgi:succinyl-CoA synthetase alpha subunit
LGIIVGKNTRVVVQGITGVQGGFHTDLMLRYGTQIVAGVTPGKGGAKVHGVPIYDCVAEAVEKHGVTASIIFVPATFAAEAALEALEAQLKTVVLITEHIPIRDTVQLMDFARKEGATIIGPNTPGIINPGECKIGIMPSHIFAKGEVGIASRSGTLTYEIAAELTRNGFGQSTCLGLGGDPIVGLSFVDVLQMFEQDNQTRAVVLIGEIGGNAEEKAAEYVSLIKNRNSFPVVVAFVAGRSAPPGKRMGHAGAIVMGKSGTAESKIHAFKEAGVDVAERPSDIPRLLMKKLHGVSRS